MVFRLEDGAVVKIKVDLDRAGVASGFTNPDGTPHYNVSASLKVNVIPAKKSFYVPKSHLRRTSPKKDKDIPFIR